MLEHILVDGRICYNSHLLRPGTWKCSTFRLIYVNIGGKLGVSKAIRPTTALRVPGCQGSWPHTGGEIFPSRVPSAAKAGRSRTVTGSCPRPSCRAPLLLPHLPSFPSPSNFFLHLYSSSPPSLRMSFKIPQPNNYNPRALVLAVGLSFPHLSASHTCVMVLSGISSQHLSQTGLPPFVCCPTIPLSIIIQLHNCDTPALSKTFLRNGFLPLKCYSQNHLCNSFILHDSSNIAVRLQALLAGIASP
ncbi:hypothetical protein J6590_030506 [Homalodisca vitripennis]|nr:hypothetical protein J6590_030506 [Homalodisca vitripennis]